MLATLSVWGELINNMINMEYSIWKNTCESFFDLSNSVKNKYLQLFPFTLLKVSEKEQIISEPFFDTYIKKGALFSDANLFKTPDRYLQKSDSTFRVTNLISPLLYLYILAIGTQVAQEYVSSRNKTRIYHAGDVKNFSYHYKSSYDNYYLDINESQDYYNYFIKVDLTGFYESISVNELFKKINRDNEILDPRTTSIYKNILSMIGDDKYPTIENHASLSYLATEIYLDESDTDIECYLDSFRILSDFQLVRYVDDLFIFFNCEKEDYNQVLTEIKNKLISIYSKERLSMNEKKFKHGLTEDVEDALKSAAYDFYVNEIKVDFNEYYSSKDLIYFFDGLTGISNNHTHDSYKAIMERAFKKEGIKYSEEEVLQYFLFYESNLFKNEEVKRKIKELISTNYNILKYSVKELVMAVCHTKDGTIIRQLLNQIFSKHRSSESDIFDETMIVYYLINRNFQHEDLSEVLTTLNPEITRFIKDYCKNSFLKEFEEKNKFNNLYDYFGQKYQLLLEDEIIWFQFFMFNYSEKLGKQLEAYSFLKVFFDRFIAHLMNCCGIDTSGDKNEPNIRRYYREGEIIKGLENIGIETIDGESVSEIIENAHSLRNESPLNHASSEILEDSNIRYTDLSKSKNDLLRIVDLCLTKSNEETNSESEKD